MYLPKTKLKPIGKKGEKVYDKRARPLSGIFTLGNKFYFKGLENIKKGAKLIVAPHLGKHKDVAATIITFHAEQVFFTANEELFKEKSLDHLVKENLRRWFKLLGPAGTENLIIALKPLRYAFAKYICSHITDIGTIPVRIGGGYNHGSHKIVENYLLNDRAVVFLQYNRRYTKSKHHSKLEEFKMGAFKRAFDMFVKYGLDIPVIPTSIKGTAGFPFLPFKKIRVNIGSPMYISGSKYWLRGNPAKNFKEDVEKTVAKLYKEF